MRRGLDSLRDLTIATVALVEGPCYGAGVALALACDLRIAGPGARFAITPAKFGISYPQEDVAGLVALVGPGQASRLLLGAGDVTSTRLPAVHELTEADLKPLRELLAATDLLVTQPIADDYRGLPVGAHQLADQDACNP